MVLVTMDIIGPQVLMVPIIQPLPCTCIFTPHGRIAEMTIKQQGVPFAQFVHRIKRKSENEELDFTDQPPMNIAVVTKWFR